MFDDVVGESGIDEDETGGDADGVSPDLLEIGAMGKRYPGG